MQAKSMHFSNFSLSIDTTSDCIRPDTEEEILELQCNHYLARGAGLSYSDSCVNNAGVIIDTSRLNHFIAFDEKTGLLVCQPHIRFAELFLIHPDFIPPIIPGTMHATLGGGIAHDVHGKNNPQQGTLGKHIQWLEIVVNQKVYICSREEHAELFYASIGGLGLTGIIKRVGLLLRKAPRMLKCTRQKRASWSQLIAQMQTRTEEYQAAWLDFLHTENNILFSGESINAPNKKDPSPWTLPRFPIRLIHTPLVSLFNHYYYHRSFPLTYEQSLLAFNNPLDKIKQWNYLYGKKGLLQFQAVFSAEKALMVLQESFRIIQAHKATPTLAVLKYFTSSGEGLLSFAQPGFTLAIDFINNTAAQSAIKTLNAFITAHAGKIYLAKDRFLTPDQCNQQYTHLKQFRAILKKYPAGMQSDMSRRLGLII